MEDINERAEYDLILLKIRSRIENNDPNLACLKIGMQLGMGNYFPVDDDWERDGSSIGRNTHINELNLHTAPLDARKRIDFLHRLSANKSIRTLVVDHRYDDLKHFEFQHMVPFFKNNNNFHNLVYVMGGDCSRDDFHSLASALIEFDSFKRFTLEGHDFKQYYLDGDGLEHDEVQEVVQALSGHLSLTSLHLTDFDRCPSAALTALLQNPNSKLAVLGLKYIGIEDEDAAILASGLADSNTLNDLDLSGNRMITEAGWQAIFGALRYTRTLNLERLSLENTSINDTATISLSNALVNNSQIQDLNLSKNHQITMAGWQAFVHVLNDPNCMLEQLSLANNGLNDEAVNSLTNALSNNDRLRGLNLSWNRITTTALQTFFGTLQNPNSALEKLDLRGNRINRNLMVHMATMLSTNNKFKEVLIGSVDLDRLHHGWPAFSRLLCNSTSIMGTYCSNHTLEHIGSSNLAEDMLPSNLSALLNLNRNNSKTEVARQKVIKTHFSGDDIDMQPFVDMELNVLPHSIAWMGRGGTNGKNTAGANGLSLSFQFFLHNPALIEMAIKQTSRGYSVQESECM